MKLGISIMAESMMKASYRKKSKSMDDKDWQEPEVKVVVYKNEGLGSHLYQKLTYPNMPRWYSVAEKIIDTLQIHVKVCYTQSMWQEGFGRSVWAQKHM